LIKLNWQRYEIKGLKMAGHLMQNQKSGSFLAAAIKARYVNEVQAFTDDRLLFSMRLSIVRCRSTTVWRLIN